MTPNAEKDPTYDLSVIKMFTSQKGMPTSGTYISFSWKILVGMAFFEDGSIGTLASSSTRRFLFFPEYLDKETSDLSLNPCRTRKLSTTSARNDTIAS